ncbi:hypothetical protein ACLB6G_01615 [Zhengella sp. ZM62]|uniref:hypothetical protein n=1 Tax=Zhengella sedimenti TaxID=3390035 RepID=UPI00397534E7
MVRFVIRFIALACLAVACIMGVLDLARSLAANRAVFTPLAQSWSETSPASLAALEQAVRGNAPAFVWDSGFAPVLGLPGFAVFAVLALLFYVLGYRPPRRVAGRFARDA